MVWVKLIKLTEIKNIYIEFLIKIENAEERAREDGVEGFGIIYQENAEDVLRESIIWQESTKDEKLKSSTFENSKYLS